MDQTSGYQFKTIKFWQNLIKAELVSLLALESNSTLDYTTIS